MKKLLGISLVAIMSVSAANAEIASKAYVDQQIGDIEEADVAEAIAAAVAPKAESSFVGSIPDASEATTIVGYVDEQVAAAASDASGALADLDLAANEATGTGNVVSEVTQTDGQIAVVKNITAEEISNKVTSLSASSTDTQYPSARLVYEQLELKANTAELGDLAMKDKVAESDLATELATKIDGKADSSFVGELPTGATATTIAGYIDEAVAAADGAMDTRMDAAEADIDALQTAVGDENSGLTKDVAANAAAIEVLETTADNLGALAVKNTVATADIDANAVTLAKLSASLPAGCQGQGAECVLKSSNGALAWEVIQRADNGQ